MKKYFISLVLSLFILLPFLYASEDITYETNAEGEVTSGTLPPDYVGDINGEVTLPDGTSFSGTGMYSGSVLTIESGEINGLTVENGGYSNSQGVVINDGTVNGVSVTNALHIQSTSQGFSGYVDRYVPTTVNGIEINPEGTRFEYPSSSSDGVRVIVQEIPAVLEIDDEQFEVASGGVVEIEPEGTVKTITTEVKHGSHPGHDHGDIVITPQASYSEFSSNTFGHRLTTEEGVISLGDAFAREYTFTGREGFDNDLVIGDGISADGAWDFTLQTDDYTFDGFTGVIYEGEPFAGTLDLTTDETVGIHGINMHAHGQGEGDFVLDGEDVRLRGEDGWTVSMLGEMSLETTDAIQRDHLDINKLHIQQTLAGATGHSHDAQSSELDLTSATFGEDGHGEHNEAPTVSSGDSGHSDLTSETHSNGGHGESHGGGTIYSLDADTRNIALFVREGIHEEHGSSFWDELNEEEEPAIDFGISSTAGNTGGSLSYSTTRQFGLGVELGELGVIMRTSLLRSEAEGVGGHAHDQEGNPYRFDLSYNLGCTGSWCFGATGFYEGELPDAEQLASLNPFSGEHNEEKHSDHD
jgi:hypothetical protein